ncbi:MAG TPA: aldehyde dehydrogenase family protein [Solirubrobacteraceae bacterium]|nr:aldehyde dehydrogenase family protein [Solirubrobacteraceae bacterium]
MDHATIIPERSIRAASGLYIDGAWRAGAGRLTVDDPATGAPVGEVAAASADQVREAVAAAHAAYPAWSALSPDERAAPLRRAYELVLERAGELARALTLEGGKPVDEGRLLARQVTPANVNGGHRGSEFERASTRITSKSGASSGSVRRCARYGRHNVARVGERARIATLCTLPGPTPQCWC